MALCEIQWRLTPFSVRSTNPGIAPAIFEPVLFLDLLSAAQIEETVRNLREIAPTFYFNVPKGYEALVPWLRRDRQLRESFFSRVRFFQYAGASIAPQQRGNGVERIEQKVRMQLRLERVQTRFGQLCLQSHGPLLAFPGPAMETNGLHDPHQTGIDEQVQQIERIG